ncbi:MAG: beta-Ala-His dipeptidase [Emergencia sp.]
MEPKNVMEIFSEISRIPRNSGSEKAVSDWLLQRARAKGLEAEQDPSWNLIIRKPGSAGREDAEPVILQAHMDMVCEKTPESTHDFEKDPIILKAEGDWIMSACGTSLGADNGIGVAYAMAILEDDSLQHPPLEVIFTVDEECGFSGVHSLRADAFRARRMINLDHADETQVLAGSCGGTGVTFRLDLEYEEAPAGKTFYRLDVSGMEGGHSGEDIHRGRGSAIELLTRLMRTPLAQICSASGGSYRLAIPREASCIVCVDPAREKDFLTHIREMESVFRREYHAAAPRLHIGITSADPEPVLTDASRTAVIGVLDLFPNGIMKMNGEIPGVVESSDNVGTLQINREEGLCITAEIRGAYMTTVRDIQDKVESLAAFCGAEVSWFGGYGAWEFRPDSPLRRSAQQVYSRMFGKELTPLVVHAGIECAMFLEKEPEMDCIAIGPDCRYFHSPGERMRISSVRKMYDFLKALLAELR